MCLTNTPNARYMFCRTITFKAKQANLHVKCDIIEIIQHYAIRHADTGASNPNRINSFSSVWSQLFQVAIQHMSHTRNIA